MRLCTPVWVWAGHDVYVVWLPPAPGPPELVRGQVYERLGVAVVCSADDCNVCCSDGGHARADSECQVVCFAAGGDQVGNL